MRRTKSSKIPHSRPTFARATRSSAIPVSYACAPHCTAAQRNESSPLNYCPSDSAIYGVTLGASECRVCVCVCVVLCCAPTRTQSLHTTLNTALLSPHHSLGDGIRSSGLGARPDGDYGANLLVPGLPGGAAAVQLGGRSTRIVIAVAAATTTAAATFITLR